MRGALPRSRLEPAESCVTSFCSIPSGAEQSHACTESHLLVGEVQNLFMLLPVLRRKPKGLRVVEKGLEECGAAGSRDCWCLAREEGTGVKDLSSPLINQNPALMSLRTAGSSIFLPQ